MSKTGGTNDRVDDIERALTIQRPRATTVGITRCWTHRVTPTERKRLLALCIEHDVTIGIEYHDNSADIFDSVKRPQSGRTP